LAATVTGTALAGAAGGGVLTLLSLMSMNKISLGLSAAVVAASATGFVVQARTNTELRSELQQLQTEDQQITALQAENVRLARTSAEVEAMRADDSVLLQLSEEAEGLRSRMKVVDQRAAQAAAAKTMYDPRALDRAPRLRTSTPPQYPAQLRQVGVEGEVVVDFVVDAAGKVHNPVIIRSSQREFEAPVLEAVSQWEFDPGQRGGRAVNTHMQMPVGFKLANGRGEAGTPVPSSESRKP
jgi:protein TonB